MAQALFVRMLGGLGNQLFQYAFARAMAEKLDVPVALDPRYVLRKGHHTGLAIQAFNIRARMATQEELLAFPEWKIRLSRGLRKLIRPTFDQYHELGMYYDYGALSRKPGELVSGFWQSERYFEHLRPKLLNEIRLVKQMPESLQALALQIESSPNALALHIRRGDYLSDPLAAKRLGACSPAYYEQALGRVDQSIGAQPEVFVFSDDPHWCKAFQPLAKRMSVTFVPDAAPEHDMILMSLCRHHIISNSTFGWWGAWLSQRTGGVQVAPTPWHNEPSLVDECLVPKKWLRVPKKSEQ